MAFKSTLLLTHHKTWHKLKPIGLHNLNFGGLANKILSEAGPFVLIQIDEALTTYSNTFTPRGLELTSRWYLG